VATGPASARPVAFGAWAALAGDAIISFFNLPDPHSGVGTGARRHVANRVGTPVRRRRIRMIENEW